VRILVVDDERAIRFSLVELLQDDGHEVREAEQAPADLVLSDLTMPAMDGMALLEEVRARHPETLFVLVTAHGDERTAVRALGQGAYGYVPKPFDNDEIRAVVRRAREVLSLRAENGRLRRELAGDFRGLIGDSPALREVVRVIRRAAPTEATVLVTGESGTGKELVARAVHDESRRRTGPFIALNCSALPGELVERELFGHVRGAFTGADRDAEGLFEAADGGTLFLDEVGDLAPPAQAKLLRALEERQVTRLGSTRPVPVDVRMVAATNRPLEVMVASGAFRDDLLYRLRVIALHIPPLRDRRADVMPLALHFLAHFAGRYGRPVRGFSDAARRLLLSYDWPGNVRELRNAVERAVVMAEEDEIGAGDVPPQLAESRAPVGPVDAALADLPFAEARDRAMEAWERRFLAAALERPFGLKPVNREPRRGIQHLRGSSILRGCDQGAAARGAASSKVPQRRYQSIMYSCVRIQLEGRDPVPWYSPAKRSSVVGTPRIFSAAKYSSDCGMGVRRSSSPVMISVGVFTLPTYIRGDCFSQACGSSQKGLSKKFAVNSGTSVWPAKLNQLITGQRTAAARKRSVWPITQLVSTPPPLHPPTKRLAGSTYPLAITASTPAIRSS
jgi:DNA-binding NtrC family response regulator